VNETIYDEVDIILQKYKSIIGDINNKKWFKQDFLFNC
jgi:hypothetical protein